MNLSESIRIGQLRRNPSACFDAFYSEFGPRVYRYCLRLSGNSSDAEDLTQEVFVGAFRGVDRFEGRCSLTTWLYRIALLRWRTLAARRTDVDSNADLANLADQPAHRPHCGAIDSIDLDRAISALPTEHRHAFVLVKAEGLTCREASAVLDIPEGTVRYHVHEAVHGLRKLLRYEDAPDSSALDAGSQTKRMEGICHDLP